MKLKDKSKVLTMEEARRLCCGDRPAPNGWIQWKGTSVCMDLHCLCGHSGHVDAEFFYHYSCHKCGRKYVVSACVDLIEVDGDMGDADFTECTIPRKECE